METYIMQFVTELKDYRPLIWRQFQINSDATLVDFCHTLMEMFHMMGYHLFDFNIKGVKYALQLPDGDDWDEPVKNMKKIPISRLFTKEGDHGEMWYDFGDC